MNREIGRINTLEGYASEDSILHQRTAQSKIIVTLGYVFSVVSFSPYELRGLLFFIVYPALAMVFSGISFSVLLKRLGIPLPFSLAAGMSHLFFNQQPAGEFNNFMITYGMVAFGNLFLKTIFTVWAVLILIGTTPLEKITQGLGKLKVPGLFIAVLEMTYRYLSILLEEGRIMQEVYLLRNPGKKALQIQDMGRFLGQLVLRSIQRAEGIFEAMKCRGYKGIYTVDTITGGEKNKITDWIFMAGMAVLFLWGRIGDLPVRLGV